MSRERVRTTTDAAVARRAFRQVLIGATVCAVVFGVTAASSALTYVTTFPTELSRRQLALTTSTDTGLAVLLGPVASVDTVGGYTVYKGFVFLTTIGAIWAVLAANRLLRGEEDSGRWQLMLAGSTRASRATAATLGALAAAVGVIFVGTTLFMLLAGRNPDVGFGVGNSLVYGLSIALPPAVFAAVGGLTSQLCRTRRTANGLGLTIFGVAFALRMIADSGPSTRWLLWATPFGWTERMQPITENDLWPLVPAAAVVLVLVVVAITMASKRDTGDGLLASRDVAPLRPFGLGSALGMTARLELPILVAWCIGAAAAGVMFGVIAKMTTNAIPKSLSDTLDKFGVQGTFVTRYFGVAFLLVATIVALLPASQVGAAGEEETSGRLVQVLVRRTGRTTWFVGRLVLAGAAVVVAGLFAGLGAWLGATSQGVDLRLVTMLGAGLNVVPTALVVLAAGAVALAIAPRAAAATVYGIVIWSLLDDLLSSLVAGLRWLEHLSLFHYMALVPAHDADLRTITVATAAALALGVIASILFDRRDVRSA
jgi:ABC-2 type transport system permease protein